MILTIAAHIIRDQSTKQFKAVYALKAQHRWCLTGTPIQNRAEDIGALVRFLRVQPFDTRSSFRQHFIEDFNSKNQSAGLERLRNLITCIALRRTKASVSNELQLPPRINETRYVCLDHAEKNLYLACRSSALTVLEQSNVAGGSIYDFCSILQSILTLRQICDHGSELLSSRALERLDLYRTAQTKGVREHNAIVESACESCGPLLTSCNAPSELPRCLHIICSSCLAEGQEALSDSTKGCPLCDRNTVVSPASPGTFSSEITLGEYQPSSKVSALLDNLQKYATESTESTESPIKRHVAPAVPSSLSNTPLFGDSANKIVQRRLLLLDQNARPHRSSTRCQTNGLYPDRR